MRLSFEFSFASRPLGQPWHSIALAAVAALFSGIAIYTFFTTSSFLEDSMEAQGSVIKLGRRGELYYPIVRYSDSDFREHTLASSIASGPTRFTVGESVVVVYAPDDPSKAKIKEFWNLWFGTFFSGLMGGAFWIGSIFLWTFREQIYLLAGYPELSGVKSKVPPVTEAR